MSYRMKGNRLKSYEDVYKYKQFMLVGLHQIFLQPGCNTFASQSNQYINTRCIVIFTYPYSTHMLH